MSVTEAQLLLKMIAIVITTMGDTEITLDLDQGQEIDTTGHRGVTPEIDMSRGQKKVGSVMPQV